MRSWKRWSVNLTSWVDGVLGQVENHEAVVSAAVVEVRKATARARVQLKRVAEDGEKLRRAYERESQAAQAWRHRAAEKAQGDEDAIECLRRSKAAEKRAERFASQFKQHETAERNLRENIKQLDGRLLELTERRNILRTRESRARALDGVASCPDAIGGVEDAIDRWDMKLTEIEILADGDVGTDTFEEKFVTEEERAELLAELKELRGTSGSAGTTPNPEEA